MKVHYRKGVAIHPGPESCGAAREGSRFGMPNLESKRWQGKRRPGHGAAKATVRGADVLRGTEGNTGRRAIASAARVPRGRRPRACVEAPCARTGRSRGHSTELARRVVWERPVVVTP